MRERMGGFLYATGSPVTSYGFTVLIRLASV